MAWQGLTPTLALPPCPPAVTLARGAMACWPPSLPGRGWCGEQEGAGGVWSCPLLGLGLDGQEHPATQVGEKKGPTHPLETPKFPW